MVILIGCPQFGGYVSACVQDRYDMISALLSLTQSASTMIVGPALALTFKRGMEMGGFWFGLSYMVATGLFFGGRIPQFWASIKGGRTDSGDLRVIMVNIELDKFN